MRKFAIVAAAAILGVAFTMSVPRAYAASKVNCDEVMKELQAGKKPKEVAKDMKISRSSVYRCRRKARRMAKAETKSHKSTAAMHKATEAGAATNKAAAPKAEASPAANEKK
jgi:DNA-binding CsgD family transcriptional regulator